MEYTIHTDRGQRIDRVVILIFNREMKCHYDWLVACAGHIHLYFCLLVVMVGRTADWAGPCRGGWWLDVLNVKGSFNQEKAKYYLRRVSPSYPTSDVNIEWLLDCDLLSCQALLWLAEWDSWACSVRPRKHLLGANKPLPRFGCGEHV